MNKELVCIFFVAFIIVLFGHQYAAVAEELPMSQDAEIARVQRVEPEVATENVAEEQTAKMPYGQGSEELVAKFAEEQNHNLKDLRGVPVNEYIKSKV